MAKKKKEIIKPSVSISYEYKPGDRVLLVANGNSKYDGTGQLVIKKTGLKYVDNIVSGATYPYYITNADGLAIGYFKGEALERV